MFEYGSGGSTLFWQRRKAKLVSIEHEPHWYEVVRGRIPYSAGVDYRLIKPEPAKTTVNQPDISDPDQYLTDDPNFRGLHSTSYVQQIDAFSDSSFDIVLIDGRARPSCIKHGARKVKLGGLLILDNAERDYYTAKTQGYLKDFSVRVFRGVIPCNRWNLRRTFIRESINPVTQ